LQPGIERCGRSLPHCWAWNGSATIFSTVHDLGRSPKARVDVTLNRSPQGGCGLVLYLFSHGCLLSCPTSPEERACVPPWTEVLGPLLSHCELANWAQVSPRPFRRWMTQDQVPRPFYLSGTRSRWYLADVAAYLNPQPHRRASLLALDAQATAGADESAVDSR
jgi:predicted DNA-binding transcriptional regulator AlpA